MDEATMRLLTRANRAVLLPARPGGGARPVPGAAWWDGAGVWMSLPDPAGLRGGLPVALLVPPAERGGQALLGHGRLRVYGVREPLRLLLHAPAVSGALSALALRGAARLPGGGVVVRVVVDHVAPLAPSGEEEGLAPALPATVPAEVRRAVAGLRTVVVSGPPVQAARWSGGLTLHGVHAPRERVAVVLDSGGPAAHAAGLLLEGPLGADGRLRPDLATWWRGTGPTETAAIEQIVPTFTLPE